MSSKTNNYSKNKVEAKKKRKALIIVIASTLSFVLTMGVVAAFFSDFFQQTFRATAGTLKINANYSFHLNGSTEAISGSEIKNLNPGDVIVIKGAISNNGNKSAWIRDTFCFDSSDSAFLPYLSVYQGEFTQADFLNPGDLSESEIILVDGVASTSNKVIDGTGNDAELEDGEDFVYLGTSSYQIIFTIYFSVEATNEVQGKIFNVIVGVQALQFRNNNLVEPSETAWSAVSIIK